jgi:pyrroline-5-carboxylate reductase
MKIAILGCGQMGETMLKGFLYSKAFKSGDFTLTTKFDDHEAQLKTKYKDIMVTQDNELAIKDADIVILAVNPDAAKEVLVPLKEQLKSKLLVSICAGITLEKLEEWTDCTRLVRAMPNIPCGIGEGTIALVYSKKSTSEDNKVVKDLFAHLGMCIPIDEKQMNTVTALAASGPAFAFVILEALADGAVMMGLSRQLAAKLTAQMFQGSARLLLETGEHPAALKDQVTTPGGITTAGLLEMEDGKIRSTLAKTIQKASSRAHKLVE